GRTSRRCHHQTGTVEGGACRFLCRDPRRTGEYRTLGRDKSSEPSRGFLVRRLPDCGWDSYSYLRDSLFVRWNNRQCCRGTALATLELVLEATQDQLLVAIPSSPIDRGRGEEA